MEFQMIHLEDGPKMENFNLKKPREDITDFIWKQKELKKKEIFVTQEFPLENNLQNWKTKLISLEKDILVTKFYQTLVQDLTQKDQILKPFWKNCSKEISEKLWLPVQTDGQDLEQMIFLNGFLKNLKENFPLYQNKVKNLKMNLQTNLWKFSQSLQQDTTEKEIIQNQKKKIVTKKIRFYPSKIQKKLLKRFFGYHRHFYNLCIEEWNKEVNTTTNEKFFKEKKYKEWKRISLREKIKINNKDIEKKFKECPFDSREMTLHLFSSNLKTNLTIHKDIKKFNYNFLKKKSSSQIFLVNHRVLKVKENKQTKKNEVKIFQKLLGKINSIFKFRNKYFKEIIKYKDSIKDFIIQKEYSKYYICLPIEKEIKININKKKEGSICSLDPGVNNFMTIYSPEITLNFIGSEILKPYFEKLDYYESCKNRKDRNKKFKNKLKLKLSLLRTKIKNVVKEFHYKISNFLTKTFDIILLPKFSSSNIIKKSKGNSYLHRYINALSHYKFRERLIRKGEENNCHVLLCTEHWTSKTCGRCGEINKDLGNKKVFSCPKCNLILDRDINGARNVLIKTLTEIN